MSYGETAKEIGKLLERVEDERQVYKAALYVIATHPDAAGPGAVLAGIAMKALGDDAPDTNALPKWVVSGWHSYNSPGLEDSTPCPVALFTTRQKAQKYVKWAELKNAFGVVGNRYKKSSVLHGYYGAEVEEIVPRRADNLPINPRVPGTKKVKKKK
jgi:hypothetical protein